MSLKTLSHLPLKNKTVLLRTDYNVASKNTHIEKLAAWRIEATIETLRYLRKKRAKIIILSHRGRPQGKAQQKFSMEPVARFLSKLLGDHLTVIHHLKGFPANLSVLTGQTYLIASAKKKISHLQDLAPGDILMLENLRFHPGETSNDIHFTKDLAGLGDVFVNDAFGTCHREHASIVGLPTLLPSAAGLLLAREVKIITQKSRSPQRPLVIIIGGAKVKTKARLIKKLTKKADSLLIGGILANTILAAQGIAIGKSLVDKEVLQMSQELELTNPHLHLPVDVVVSTDFSGKKPLELRPVGKIGKNNIILDIGPDTRLLFETIIKQARTIIWNGPMGMAEIKKFAQGTEAVFQAFVNARSAYKIIGGGDTIALVAKRGMLRKVNFVSTGGGALLQLFAGEKLPGIEILRR